MTDFVNAVSSVGFPIACCIFLLWQNAKQDEQRQRELAAMRKVMASMQKTLDENTRVLTQLVSNLKGDKHVKEDEENGS
jgi:hypothetical protein